MKNFLDIRLMPRRPLALRGSGVSALRERLMNLCRAGQWPLVEPLPVTRFLGESFGISNVSAFRVLNELKDSGQLWRAANGRYFLASARRLLEKPAPVACLFRRLERWTAVGREIMQGVDEACGKLDRAILLVHDRVLFRQADATSPASHGTDSEMTSAMDDFLLVHSELISGVILDELWTDRLLAKFKDRLRSGVVVYRPTKHSFLGCVSGDAEAAAQLAIEHARSGGFDRVGIVLPFQGYEPSDQMAMAAARAASVGQFPIPTVFSMESPGTRGRLITALRKQSRRILLIVTEDNAAVAVFDLLNSAGIEVPRRVGILSTMGSRIAGDRSITTTGFDFVRMGAEAGRMAVSGKIRHLALPPRFTPGSTT